MFIGDNDTDAEFRAIDVGELLSDLDVSGHDLTDSDNSQTIWDSSNSHIPSDAIESSGLDADRVDGWEANELRNPKNIAQLSTTDTSTNINQSSWITIPWNTEYALDAAYTHDAGTAPGTITFDEAGTYRVMVSLAYDGTGSSRSNPGVKLNVNGSRKKTFGLSGYVRASSGHDEASNVVFRTITVESGDTLKVQTTQMGDTGTVTLRSEESILEIEQLSVTSAVVSDADSLDGLDSSQFLRSDTSTTLSGGTLSIDLTTGSDAVIHNDSSGGDANQFTYKYNDIPLRFYTGSGAGSSGPTVFMDQNQQVGIAQNSANYTLDVNGIINASGDILGSGSVVWDSSSGHVPSASVQSSGLDADTIDGAHKSDLDSQYVDADGDTMSGNLTISHSATSGVFSLIENTNSDGTPTGYQFTTAEDNWQIGIRNGGHFHIAPIHTGSRSGFRDASVLSIQDDGNVDAPLGQLSEQGDRVATRNWTNNNADVPNADHANSAGDADTLDGSHKSDLDSQYVDVSGDSMNGRLSMGGNDLYFQPSSDGGSVTALTFESNTNSGSDFGYIEYHDDYFGDGSGEASALVLRTENDSPSDTVVLDGAGGTEVVGGDLTVQNNIHENGNRVATRSWTNSNFNNYTFSENHDDLSGVSSSDHHSRYSDSEARSAVTGTTLPGPLNLSASNFSDTALDINTSNQDYNIWYANQGSWGYRMEYAGSPTGNDNALRLYSDDGGQIWEILQDGSIDFLGSISESGNRVATRSWASGNNLGWGDLAISQSDIHVSDLGNANSDLNMSNQSITNVHRIVISDPGSNEGVEWSNWGIYESPNDLSNGSGNFQIENNGTRAFTVDQNQQAEATGGFKAGNFEMVENTNTNSLDFNYTGA